MSGELLSRAWRVRGLKPAERLVLILMADLARAEHQNAIWLFQGEIAEKVELHPDTVKAALAALTAAGHLTRQVRRGKQTIYTVQPIATEGSETPYPAHAVKQSRGSEAPHLDDLGRGSEGSITPPTKGPKTPPLRGEKPLQWGVSDPSYITINNHQEPPVNHQVARNAAPDLPEPLPSWVPPEAFRGFADMRKRVNAPLSARGQKLVIEKLQDLRDQGHDPQRVLDQSTANSYRDLFPLKENRNNAAPRFASSTPPDGPAPSPLFAAAAGLARQSRQRGNGRVDR